MGPCTANVRRRPTVEAGLRRRLPSQNRRSTAENENRRKGRNGRERKYDRLGRCFRFVYIYHCIVVFLCCCRFSVNKDLYVMTGELPSVL